MGDVDDPDGNRTDTDIISGATPAVGETIRINTGGDDAEVQWQVSNTMGGYDDIDGATDLELTVTNDHAGKMLRAKVTYTADDNPATTDVDEEGWPIWVEYTEVLTVSGDVENNNPAATQTAYEIRVELPATKTVVIDKETIVRQPAAIVNDDDIADLFFDSDGNDLTYSITGVTPDLAASAVDDTDAGYDAELSEGMQVYRSYTTTIDSGTSDETRADLQQTIAIDKDTGEITYFSDTSQTHDGDDTDGAGNTLVVTVSATDGMLNATPATIPVTVRINVAPTAIELDDGTATAANLPPPPKFPAKAGTALTDGAGDVTYMDDEEYAAGKVADLDIMDQNSNSDMFGTHEITLSGKGANMFEIRETDTDNDPDDGDDDSDGSTWELWLKKDATFNFEALKGKTDTGSTTLYITVTAKDGGNLSTKGVFTVKVMDVANTEADQEAAEKAAAAKEAADEKKADADEEAEKIKDEGPDVPGLKDDSDDGDDDGAVPPPPEDEMMGFAPGDDLLDSFVLAIDDIDVA